MTGETDRGKLLEEYNRIRDEFLKIYNTLVNGEAKKAVVAGDTEARDYWLRQSAKTGKEREQLGEKDAQAKNLVEIGQGLTAQQQEDMLRAALGCGFGASAVFDAAKTLEVLSPTTELLLRNATEYARESMGKMTDILQDNGLTEKEKRQKLDEETARLAYMVDSEPEKQKLAKRIEKDLEDMLSKSNKSIEAAIDEQMRHAQALINIHAYQFKGVGVLAETPH